MLSQFISPLERAALQGETWWAVYIVVLCMSTVEMAIMRPVHDNMQILHVAF